MARRWLPRLSLLAVGLLLSVLLVELALRAGGAAFLWAQGRRNLASLGRAGEVRVLCLGESTTAFGGRHSYPRLLERILNERSSSLRFSVVNRGLPASTTPRILESVPGWLDEYRPQLVVTMMGTNDHWVSDVAPDTALGRFLRSLRVARLLRLIHSTLEGDDPEGGGSLPGRPGLKRVADQLARLADQVPERAEATELLEAELLASIEQNPRDSDAPYHDLAVLYLLLRRFDDGHAVLEAALEAGVDSPAIRDELDHIHLPLALGHERAGRLEEAEALLRKTLDDSVDPNRRAITYGRFGMLNLTQGQESEAAQYFRQATELRTRYYNRATWASYRQLKDALGARGVPLIAVQYPGLSVAPLAHLLGDAPNVVIVDNEASFKQAVRRDGFEAYFVDAFGGEFGHMTAQGHELLASNVATAILSAFDEGRLRQDETNAPSGASAASGP